MVGRKTKFTTQHKITQKNAQRDRERKKTLQDTGKEIMGGGKDGKETNSKEK